MFGSFHGLGIGPLFILDKPDSSRKHPPRAARNLDLKLLNEAMLFPPGFPCWVSCKILRT